MLIVIIIGVLFFGAVGSVALIDWRLNKIYQVLREVRDELGEIRP